MEKKEIGRGPCPIKLHRIKKKNQKWKRSKRSSSILPPLQGLVQDHSIWNPFLVLSNMVLNISRNVVFTTPVGESSFVPQFFAGKLLQFSLYILQIFDYLMIILCIFQTFTFRIICHLSLVLVSASKKKKNFLIAVFYLDYLDLIP